MRQHLWKYSDALSVLNYKTINGNLYADRNLSLNLKMSTRGESYLGIRWRKLQDQSEYSVEYLVVHMLCRKQMVKKSTIIQQLTINTTEVGATPELPEMVQNYLRDGRRQ